MLYERLIAEVFQNITEHIEALINQVDAQENKRMSLDAHLEAADEKTLAMQLFDVMKSIDAEKALANVFSISSLIASRLRLRSPPEDQNSFSFAADVAAKALYLCSKSFACLVRKMVCLTNILVRTGATILKKFFRLESRAFSTGTSHACHCISQSYGVLFL